MNYNNAVRAYRQLATVLRTQGINEIADRFSYRTQLCQRTLLRSQGIRGIGGYFWSVFLDLLAGYGFKPIRTLFVCLFIISLYASLYYFIGQTETHLLSPLGSVIFSITSFHGRGFFPGGLSLDDRLTVLAASEAIVGLIIEISFIATFPQRFFSR